VDDARSVPPDVILICPCCAAALDAASSETEFECAHCGQKWTMSVDAARLAAHAL